MSLATNVSTIVNSLQAAIRSAVAVRTVAFVSTQLSVLARMLGRRLHLKAVDSIAYRVLIGCEGRMVALVAGWKLAFNRTMLKHDYVAGSGHPNIGRECQTPPNVSSMSHSANSGCSRPMGQLPSG
jgi:hypothetical protein